MAPTDDTLDESRCLVCGAERDEPDESRCLACRDKAWAEELERRRQAPERAPAGMSCREA